MFSFSEWDAIDKDNAESLLDSFVQTLTFPGGWLLDCALPGSLVAQTPERLAETRALRRACVPQLCLMLLRVCLESGLHARARAVVALIVDPQHALSRAFAPLELSHALRMAAEIQLSAEIAGGEAAVAPELVAE